MVRLTSVVLLTLVVLGPVPALAHEQLLAPVPRAKSNQKVAPCGGVERGSKPTSLTAGSTLLMKWKETIHHPGWFRISFSEMGADDFADHVLEDHIPSEDGVDDYQHALIVPDVPCQKCVLQLVQVMTDQPASQMPSGYKEYYACADVTIAAATQDLPSAPVPADQEPTATPSEPPAGTPEPADTATPAAAASPAASAAASPQPSGGCRQAGPEPILLWPLLLRAARRRAGPTP